jgi:competence CoiA-like predicted nuclease
LKELVIKGSSAESYAHKVIKHLVYDGFYQKTNIIAVREMEKHFGNRFADIYFQLKSGKKIVIEIQNSKISIQELKQRTKDYNHLGIYVLWIIHGEGTCVSTKKYPYDAKKLKISPTENYLHQMYGGRVYYINLDLQNIDVKLKRPFALHFTKPIKKNMRGIFHTRYERYFYRDVNFTFIPNWNLLCTEFAGYKIARFYDKNIKYALKEQIKRDIDRSHLHSSIKKNCQLKSIIKQFKKKYGEYMILNLLIELFNEEKLILGQKIFKKIQKKLLIK